MFISKESTAVVTLDRAIRVAGLSLQRSGIPVAFESMGTLWERYGERHRGRVDASGQLVTEYGVCLNSVPDYITGCEAPDTEPLGDGFAAFVIPAGRYIKDTFNAESFEQLVMERLAQRSIAEWVKRNKVVIDPGFVVEVYPWGRFDKGDFTMYTLTPVAG